VRFDRRPARALGVAGFLLVTVEAMPARAVNITVRAKNPVQRITGFGASSAWTAPSLASSDADLLFTRDAGINLTLLRVRIAPPALPPPDGACTTAEVATAQAALARGATVWATPWSPPPFWKSNDSLNNGGTLLPEHADDWANCLAGFVAAMAALRPPVPIAYLSAQNEPTTGDATINYESCLYTPPTLADFIANHLSPALAAAGLTTPIMAPETEGWGASEMTLFTKAILASPKAAAAIGVYASHSYSGTPSPMTTLAAGQGLWETEWYDKEDATADPGIGSALRLALQMTSDLVNGNVNAWLYWWIMPQSPDNGALWDLASRLPAKRLYAMGNFSRFVLPGYLRVPATTSAPNPDVTASAYVDPASTQVVVVAINESTSPVPQTFLFDGVATGSWMSWVTSATENSTSAGAPVDGGADPSALTATLEAQSITTFVGAITGPGPALPQQDSASLTPAGDGGGGCACSAAPGRSANDAEVGGMALAAVVGAGFRRRASRRARARA
jgi:glucuronoarabinoxylan endo-1,4-beta-xylanase